MIRSLAELVANKTLGREAWVVKTSCRKRQVYTLQPSVFLLLRKFDNGYG